MYNKEINKRVVWHSVEKEVFDEHVTIKRRLLGIPLSEEKASVVHILPDNEVNKKNIGFKK